MKFLSFIGTLILLGIFLIAIAIVGYFIMVNGYHIVAFLFVIFSLATYYNFTGKISMTILWILYLAYLFSPLFYDTILMSPWEAVIKNILLVFFFLWLTDLEQGGINEKDT